jgi:glutaredoxin
MKKTDKSTGEPGGKKEPAISRGIIAGVAILFIAIAAFAILLLGNSGTAPGNCDTTAGACAVTTMSTTATPVALVKSARPSVEIYVMSFCPYGIQAENALKPVVELLNAGADFRMHYIATVPGSDLSTAKSLHGNAEAVEDAQIGRDTSERV